MSDTPETDDFTLGPHQCPVNSKGETMYEALQRVERERNEARKVAKQLLHQHPASFLRPSLQLPWEGTNQ